MTVQASKVTDRSQKTTRDSGVVLSPPALHSVRVYGPGPVGIGIVHDLMPYTHHLELKSRTGNVVCKNMHLWVRTHCSAQGYLRSWRLDRVKTAIRVPNVVVLAVKSYDLESALAQVCQDIDQDIEVERKAQNSFESASSQTEWPMIVTTCNGAVESVLDRFCKEHPEIQLGHLISTVGMRWQSKDPCLLERSADGQNSWGLWQHAGAKDSEAIETFRQVASALPHWHEASSDGIRVSLREKWLVSAVINSLSAELDCERNGDLLDEQLLERLGQVIEEAYSLGEVLWGEWPSHWSQSDAIAKVKAVLQATYHNQNSMVADVRAGRKIEHDFLLGLLHSQAAKKLDAVRLKQRFPELLRLAKRLTLLTRV